MTQMKRVELSSEQTGWLERLVVEEYRYLGGAPDSSDLSKIRPAGRLYDELNNQLNKAQKQGSLIWRGRLIKVAAVKDVLAYLKELKSYE